MSPKARSPFSTNRLLAALPSRSLARWKKRFECVDLKLGVRLSKAAKPIDHVYFPESGMISLLQSLHDGVAIEVGLIGNEGFLGVPLLLGARSSPMTAMVQGDGTAWRLPAKVFVKACRESAVRGPLLRYAQALHVQVTQTAICNARHTVRERLGRWLLEIQDRLGELDLRVSHEFLALMLGSRRAGVTEALGAFRAARLITTERRYIHIRDRKGLEAAACECHAVVAGEYGRLL